MQSAPRFSIPIHIQQDMEFFVLHSFNETSSAGAEISDGPHKGGALEGLDQMISCLCIIQCKEIYLYLLFC